MTRKQLAGNSFNDPRNKLRYCLIKKSYFAIVCFMKTNFLKNISSSTKLSYK